METGIAELGIEADAEYVGARWFSRFLGAPPAADTLSARDDFCPLGELADVALGLKSGADKWFFVETPDRPRVDALGRPRLRASIRVVSNLGWEGELSAADLVPALLNPHTLIERRGGGQPSLRRLAPPTRTEIAYVFPQDRRPTLGLADYISHGERHGIHERQLVSNNADGARWWRQRRAMLRPAWALPYNSGYDYGSHENAAGLVINGRFVGVDPREEIDNDLLGAALLSSFPIVTRLQEGVATGTEGAYDVGPPAAKLMRIPNVSKFKNATGVSAVRDVLGALRAQNLIPPAPDRKGNVDPLRRSLDEAILKALGLAAGESAVLLDEVYSSYAEWRSATEDVETRMREHRRAMAQSGRTRTQDPAEVVARAIADELVGQGKIPALPADVLPNGADMQSVAVTDSFTAPDQHGLFDSGFITAPNGQQVDLGDYDRVRYAAMLLEIGFRSPLRVPTDARTCEKVCHAYDVAVARFQREAARLANRSLPDEQANDAIQIARRLWRHACQAAGMDASTDEMQAGSGK